MTRQGFLARLVLLVALLPASSALAQTCGEHATASERFACAAQAAEDGLWADALTQFQALYEETHAPSALFNVGIAFQSLGRHREARDAFDHLMRDHAADLDDETRTEAARQYGTEAARVARVRLHDVPHPSSSGWDATLRVRLDGRTLSVGDDEPLVLEADPGAHGVSVTQDAHEEFVWEGTLADGQSLDLDVTMPLLPVSSRPIYEEAGFWIAIVLGACAIAGGAVLGWWLQQDAQLDTRGGFVIPVGG